MLPSGRLQTVDKVMLIGALPALDEKERQYELDGDSSLTCLKHVDAHVSSFLNSFLDVCSSRVIVQEYFDDLDTTCNAHMKIPILLRVPCQGVT